MQYLKTIQGARYLELFFCLLFAALSALLLCFEAMALVCTSQLLSSINASFEDLSGPVPVMLRTSVIQYIISYKSM
jgi:hypothetical protein